MIVQNHNKEKLDQVKLFRLSKEDTEILEKHVKREKEKKSGLDDESKYIRYLIRNRPSADPEIKKTLSNLVFEINKIGVNINQITKDYNSLFYEESDKKKLEALLKQVKFSFEKLRKDLNKSREE